MSSAVRRERWAIYWALARMSGRLLKAVVNGDTDTISATEIHADRLHARLDKLS